MESVFIHWIFWDYVPLTPKLSKRNVKTPYEKSVLFADRSTDSCFERLEQSSRKVQLTASDSTSQH